MPTLSHPKASIKPKLHITMAGNASAALTAAAGSTGGQEKRGQPKSEHANSDDDGRLSATSSKKPDTSEEEDSDYDDSQEETKGTGLSADDLEDFQARECGREKLLNFCKVQNSVAREMMLNGGSNLTELEVAEEFS